MKSKVAIYARLSREDEDKIDGNKSESRSIENQIKVLSDYARENDLDIYKIYYDDGYSGANFERPEFKKLLKDMYQHKFDTILIKDISRLGRVVYKVGELIECIFPKNNIRVISLNVKYDSLTYNDDQSIVIRNFLNDYYLKEFKRKCRQARTHYARTKHLNYYPKYGYNFDKDRKEIIDDYSANIVKRIFDYVANQGLSTCQVAEILNKEGVLTRSLYATRVLGLKALNKNPAKEWSGEKVWEIVKDYEYCGHSKNWVRHIKEEQILIKDTHLAIIDEETFNKAQKNIEDRSTRKNKVKHIGKLLIDRKTGKNLLYGRTIGKEDKATYFCRVNNLRVYSIKARAIEDIIYRDTLNVIQCCKLDQERFYNFFKERIFNGKEYNQEKLKDKLNKLNEEYSQILEAYFNQTICEEIYEKKSQKLLFDIKETEIDIERCSSYKAQIELLEIRFKKFLESIKSLSVIEPFEIISKVVSKVYIENVSNPDTFQLTIIYKFEET